MSKNTDLDNIDVENNNSLGITKINTLLRKINKLKKNIKNTQINFDITKIEEYKNFFQSLEIISDEVDILSFKITGNKDIDLESKISKYNRFMDINKGLMTYMFLYQLGTIDKDYNFIDYYDSKIQFSGYDFLTKYSEHLKNNPIPKF